MTLSQLIDGSFPPSGIFITLAMICQVCLNTAVGAVPMTPTLPVSGRMYFQTSNLSNNVFSDLCRFGIVMKMLPGLVYNKNSVCSLEMCIVLKCMWKALTSQLRKKDQNKILSYSSNRTYPLFILENDAN